MVYRVPREQSQEEGAAGAQQRAVRRRKGSGCGGRGGAGGQGSERRMRMKRQGVPGDTWPSRRNQGQAASSRVNIGHEN